MPRLHAIELLPDDAGCDVVRRDWQALRDAGLPSQLDHRGTTNSPHVTVVAAPALDADDEQRARELVGSLLPVEARAGGIALLGGARVSLVRLLDVPDELVRAVLDLRSGLSACSTPAGFRTSPWPAASAGSTYPQPWRCSATTTSRSP